MPKYHFGLKLLMKHRSDIHLAFIGKFVAAITVKSYQLIISFSPQISIWAFGHPGRLQCAYKNSCCGCFRFYIFSFFCFSVAVFQNIFNKQPFSGSTASKTDLGREKQTGTNTKSIEEKNDNAAVFCHTWSIQPYAWWWEFSSIFMTMSDIICFGIYWNGQDIRIKFEYTSIWYMSDRC